MAEDRKENEMRIVDGVDYVRGLVGKDSVVITPANLLSNMFCDRGIYEGDMNKLKTPGMYYTTGLTTNISDGSVGLALVFCSNVAVVQMTFDVFRGIERRRILLYNNGEWDIWSNWT